MHKQKRLAMWTLATLAACLGPSRVLAAGTETCSKDATGTSVTCTLSSGASSIDLSTVLSDAQALNSAVNSSSPIVITALGGAGATGNGGGKTGPGGSAQMATRLADLKSSYNTTKIYYYVGAQGSNDHPGGKGGTATIVSVADLSSTTAMTANVLLIAGGGGGGSASGSSGGGHEGGSGGAVVSTVGASATAAGAKGVSDADAGSGAGGAGGTGGAGGSGKDCVNGTAGNSGLGGQGGPVHVGNGPSTSTGWLNVSGVPTGIGTNGQGGEGEYRDGYGAEGGGGGGGYGGGGGGACGGSFTGFANGKSAGGAGGGGGSYAAASSVSTGLTVTGSGNDGSVIITILKGPTT
ncbi:MAG TPA: hypothetical protein VFE33_29425 [Thermoanaerobaculia bacterium]|nr:hypothetical protein [Thermoanaerobaculia bacterium]